MTDEERIEARLDSWLRAARQIVGNRDSTRPDRARYDSLLAEFRREFPGLPARLTEKGESALRVICGV